MVKRQLCRDEATITTAAPEWHLFRFVSPSISGDDAPDYFYVDFTAVPSARAVLRALQRVRAPFERMPRHVRESGNVRDDEADAEANVVCGVLECITEGASDYIAATGQPALVRWAANHKDLARWHVGRGAAPDGITFFATHCCNAWHRDD